MFYSVAKSKHTRSYTPFYSPEVLLELAHSPYPFCFLLIEIVQLQHGSWNPQMSVSACMECVSVNEAVSSSYACQEGVEE